MIALTKLFPTCTPSRRFYFMVIILCANHFDIRASDLDFLDDDIPPDWRDYVDKTMTDTWRVDDHNSGLFQGDIAGVDPQTVVPGATFANAVSDENLRWPNKLVPYEFSEQLKLRSDVQEFVLRAFEDIHNKTCVRFIPRKYEKDYILISAGLTCWSYIGRIGNKQIVSIHPGCQDGLGALQHEFLHVLGIIHEQTRPDRDKHIWINKKNLPNDNNTQEQFLMYSTTQVSDLQTPYDYESVMHYGWNAFAKNKNYPTLLPKQKGKKIGQRQKLSTLDTERVNRVYHCKSNGSTSDELLKSVDFSKSWKDWFGLCDGEITAPEGWDEDRDVCLKMCHKLDLELFGGGKVLFNLPNTGRCMRKNYLCDGIRDQVSDISEDKNVCRKYCRGGGFVAVSPTYQCLHFSSLCDGKQDIEDGSDEQTETCISACERVDGLEKELFNLESTGRCMLKTWMCDGSPPRTQRNQLLLTAEDPEVCKRQCKGHGYFPTDDTSQCIHWNKLCNGRNDTRTGWDEVKRHCRRKCPNVPGMEGDLFNVPETGRCLNKRWLCDGFKDGDWDTSEDRETCLEFCTGNGYFPADDTKQCIRATDLCDGKQDTRNGWDEVPANCQRHCRPMMAGMHNLRLDIRTSRCYEVQA